MTLELEEQYEKIYRYCYFKVSDQYLAEDLTQETFLRFFRQSIYLKQGKTLAYLYTIARNLCIDHYRRQTAVPLENSAQTDDFTGQLETNLTMRQALTTLPEDTRELIMLRYANELSMNEITAVTGFSRFIIHRKINEALHHLHKILREEDFYA